MLPIGHLWWQFVFGKQLSVTKVMIFLTVIGCTSVVKKYDKFEVTYCTVTFLLCPFLSHQGRHVKSLSPDKSDAVPIWAMLYGLCVRNLRIHVSTFSKQNISINVNKKKHICFENTPRRIPTSRISKFPLWQDTGWHRQRQRVIRLSEVNGTSEWTFLTSWPWPLTYDLDLPTWARYPSTWPPCKNSSLYVCSFGR